MSALAQWQRRFLTGVFADEGAQDETSGELAAGLAVYRRNVLANLHDALSAAYPVVRRLVGDPFFRESADRFARIYPSPSGDLHRYGAEFPRFLEDYSHASRVACLPDVARLEWARARAFHAADGALLDFRALAEVSEDARGRIRLRLHPAARLVKSPHPILAIWEANQPDRDGTPSRTEGPDHVLVCRHDFAVHMRGLSAPDWLFLKALDGGATLDDLAADPVIASRLEEHLVEWTGNGVIHAFELSSPG